MRRRILLPLLLIGLVLFGWSRLSSALPSSQAEKARIIGQPATLIVQPARVSLTGLRSVQQLVVSGNYADGTVRDLTSVVEARLEGSNVTLGDGLFLEAVKPGSGSLLIQAGSLKVSVPVTVSGGESPAAGQLPQ